MLPPRLPTSLRRCLQASPRRVLSPGARPSKNHYFTILTIKKFILFSIKY